MNYSIPNPVPGAPVPLAIIGGVVTSAHLKRIWEYIAWLRKNDHRAYPDAICIAFAYEGVAQALLMEMYYPVGDPANGPPTINQIVGSLNEVRQELRQRAQHVEQNVQELRQEMTRNIQRMGDEVHQLAQGMAWMARRMTQTENGKADDSARPGEAYLPVPNRLGRFPPHPPAFQPITSLAVIEAAEEAQLRLWELFYFSAESHAALPERRMQIALEVGVNGLTTTHSDMLH